MQSSAYVPGVRARQPDEPRILRHPERHPVLLPQLLELRHDAVRDVRHALRVEAVHHPLHEVDLILDGKVYEVRVDDDVVRRTKRGVMLEEERRGSGLAARRGRWEGRSAGEKFRASRRQARERETHMCFTSGSSSRFFFVFLPLSTRASLGFSTRLTSANFLVFVLFLPMAPYPTLVPWSSVPRRRHFRDDGRANDSTDASSTR